MDSVQNLEKSNNSLVFQKIDNLLIDFSTSLATALIENNKTQVNERLIATLKLLFPISQLLQLAQHQNLISQSNTKKLLDHLQQYQTEMENFINHRPTILILSSIMGQGHMSAAKAIKGGVQHLFGQDYHVEIVDFFEQVASLLNKTSIKAYESSSKHTPKLWQYFYEGTDSKWAVKFVNLLNYPLASAKIEKFFESHQPDIIISTYPLWDYLASLVLKKFDYSRFISVVTDSISVHTYWNCANLDYHIVPNEETAVSLRKIGVKTDKIKILGFPVSTQFMEPLNKSEFLQSQGLSPEKFTVLFLPTAEKPKNTIKTLEQIQHELPDINLITICGRNAELYPKLVKQNWPDNFKILSWTNLMPAFIKSADLVVTKAGGATVMECVAAKKPMIITQIIPGQETGNAELIKLYNLGIIQKQANMEISECIKYIRDNQQQFLKGFEKVSKPESAIKVARFIDELLQEKKTSL